MKYKHIRKIYLVAFFLTLLVLFFAILRNLGSLHVNVQFKNLRPFKGHADVFYKGYKIGRSVNIYPSKDYKHTVVKLLLYPVDLTLPSNVTAHLKKKTVLYKFQHDYIELVEPKEHSKDELKNFDTIKGVATIDIKDYLASQDPESLDEMKKDMQKTIKDLDYTFNALGDLFSSLNNTVLMSQSNIAQSTKNIKETTSNIAQISAKLNKALSENHLNNTASNVDITSDYIKQSAKNLEEMTSNVNSLSKDLSQQSDEINSAIKSTSSALSNVDAISQGLNSTLSKKFGGLRLIFGTPIGK